VSRHVALMLWTPDSQVTHAYELALGALGVRVIWLRSFDDIPGAFERIYSAAGGTWADVYDSRLETMPSTEERP
jgi:hypothetical protein